MIPRFQAIRILSEVSAIEVATATWEAGAVEDGRATNAGAVLDLDSGQIVTFAWADRKDIPASRCIVLYTVSAARREAAAAKATCGGGVSPSADVVQETALHGARAGWSWGALEARLDRAYARHDEEAR